MMDADAEIWKPFPDWPEYEVSSVGRYRSLDRVVMRGNGRCQTIKGRIMKPNKHRDGYLQAQLQCVGEKNKKVRLHQAVYRAFVGEIPDGFDINHKNGIKHDNRISNLETCTRAENIQHARDVLGKVGTQKLQRDQVERIKALHAFNSKVYSRKALAAFHGVDTRTVSNIKTGTRWSDVEPCCPYEARKHVPHRFVIEIFNPDGTLSNTLTIERPADHWAVCVY